MTAAQRDGVLAWFDADAASWQHVFNLTPGATISDPDGSAMARLQEARAAVAELYAAAKDAHRCLFRDTEQRRRLGAALSRMDPQPGEES